MGDDFPPDVTIQHDPVVVQQDHHAGNMDLDFPEEVTFDFPDEVTHETEFDKVLDLHPSDLPPPDFPPPVDEPRHQHLQAGIQSSGSASHAPSDFDTMQWVKRIYSALQQQGALKHCPRSVRIMIDCCGILAPVIALELLQHLLDIKIELVGVCDNDPFIIEFVQAHFQPEHLWSDMVSRDTASLPKDIDLYISGFMCTPWSLR